MHCAFWSFWRKGKGFSGFGVRLPMFFLCITAQLKLILLYYMELACYYSRTKTVNYSYNSSSLLLGFVYVKKKKYRICKFSLLQELKQRRLFFFSLNKHKPHTKQQSWWMFISPTKYGSHLERWESSRSSLLLCQETWLLKIPFPRQVFSKGKEWSGEIYQQDLSMPEG